MLLKKKRKGIALREEFDNFKILWNSKNNAAEY